MLKNKKLLPFTQVLLRYLIPFIATFDTLFRLFLKLIHYLCNTAGKQERMPTTLKNVGR